MFFLRKTVFHLNFKSNNSEGAEDLWLARSPPDRVVWVRAFFGDVVLCFWARHLTLTVPLSTQVYK